MIDDQGNRVTEFTEVILRDLRWQLAKNAVLQGGGTIYAQLQLADLNAGFLDGPQRAVAEYRQDRARWDRLTLRALRRRLKFSLTGK